MTVEVTIWNEYMTQEENDKASDVYPDGIHGVLAEFLSEAGFATRTALLSSPDHGLSEPVLDGTDVLLWWSHVRNDEVDDDVVTRVCDRVRNGMGLIVLHSGLHSKVFKRLMGTRCKPDVGRNDGEMERIWFLDNRHPILENVGGKYFELEESQVFTEPFSIPTPDELVFVSWNEGGDLFRSGCCFQRENGKIFFFGPGHETHPVYYQPEVQQILVNAVRWAKPVDRPSMEG